MTEQMLIKEYVGYLFKLIVKDLGIKTLLLTDV